MIAEQECCSIDWSSALISLACAVGCDRGADSSSWSSKRVHDEMMDSCAMLMVRVGGNARDSCNTETADWKKGPTARPACGLSQEECVAVRPGSEHTSFESEYRDSDTWCKVGAGMPELTCFDHSARGDAAAAVLTLVVGGGGGGGARDGDAAAESLRMVHLAD